MSYVVTNTRGQIIAVVQDGTVDTTSTSQTLVGKNVTPYGEYEIENLVHQLENFANTTPPGNPIEGQLWWDSTNKKMMAFTGTAWAYVSVNGSSENVASTVVLRDGNSAFSTGNITSTGVTANTVLITGNGANSTIVFRDNDGNVTDTKIFYQNSTVGLNVNVNANTAATFFSDGTTFNYPVTVPLTPTISTQAASKGYVDSAVANAGFGSGTVSSVGIDAGFGISVTGGPITTIGNITVEVDASSNNVANTVVRRNSNGNFAAGRFDATSVYSNTVTVTGSGSTARVDFVNNDTSVFYNTTTQGLTFAVNSNAAATFYAGNSTFNYPVNVPVTPVNSTHATSKNYVDTAITNAISNTGGGTVLSVGIEPGFGITTSGGPITSAGNITVGVVANFNNTPSTIVRRDAAGNFAAGNITTTGIRSNAMTITGSGGSSTLTFLDNSGAPDDSAISYNNATGGIKITVNGQNPATFFQGYTDFNYAVNVPLTPTAARSATSKQYVDSAIAANSGGYSLPTASASTLGGIKVGSGLSINPSTGVLSATGGGGGGDATLGTVQTFTALKYFTGGIVVGNASATNFASYNFWDNTGDPTNTSIYYYPAIDAMSFAVQGNSVAAFYPDRVGFLKQVEVSGLGIKFSDGTVQTTAGGGGGGSGNANGPTGSVQFNGGNGAFAGSSALSWNGNTLTVGNASITSIAFNNVYVPYFAGSNIAGIGISGAAGGGGQVGVVLDGMVTPPGGAVASFRPTRPLNLGSDGGGPGSPNSWQNFYLTGVFKWNGRDILAPTGNASTFLRNDGTWAVPPSSQGITQIIAGSGLSGGTITASGTIAVDNTVVRTNAVQTISSLKYFTGGISSQAYNFTYTGNSIFWMGPENGSNPVNVVQIAVSNKFPHYFYDTKMAVVGNADQLWSGDGYAATITGIDNGSSGGSGVLGWHTSAVAGLGVGVTGYASNMAYTGAIIQSSSARTSSSSFKHIRAYSNNNPVFWVDGQGDVAYDGTLITPASDYAEYFEWADGNPNNEDRVGMTVALEGAKIKIAQPGDTVLGVISAVPAITGDAAELEWKDRWITDDWGRVQYDPYYAWEWEDKEGRKHSVASYEDQTQVPKSARRVDVDGFGNPLLRPRQNPNFNPNLSYVPRSKRKEWAPVGLLGKLRVRTGQTLNTGWIKLRDITENIQEYLVK